MNNNRGNNRRRGRGNNRPQGGGQQLNRIDSRARGNAPQLLEKYRKLAHDAHLNGDRVTEEYYLQFADHYFRVIADARLRQEEQRQRRDDRWQDGADEADDQSEYAASEYQPYDQQGYAVQDRPARGDRGERPAREDRPRDDRRDDRPREERRDRDEREREDRPSREPRGEAEAPAQGFEEADGEVRNIYEPPANPFVRENRPTRGLRPRRDDRRPRRGEDDGDAGAEAPAGFDASVLPPSLAAAREEPVGNVALTDDDSPAPKRRGRKPKAAVPAPE